MKGRSASKIKLTSYDELLGGGEETNDMQYVRQRHINRSMGKLCLHKWSRAVC